MLIGSLVIPIFEIAVFESNSVAPFPDGFASYACENDWLVVDFCDVAGVWHGKFGVGHFSTTDEVTRKGGFF